REVAYTISECAPGDIGLTDLYAGAPFPLNWRWSMRSVRVEERPLAFTPDSTRVLAATADDRYRLVTIPAGDDPVTVRLPVGVHAAAFTTPHDVTVAYRAGGSGDTIATYDLATGARRRLFDAPNHTVSSMSFDPASGALLIVA